VHHALVRGGRASGGLVLEVSALEVWALDAWALQAQAMARTVRTPTTAHSDRSVTRMSVIRAAIEAIGMQGLLRTSEEFSRRAAAIGPGQAH
jgi:hypothetical protein